MKDGMLFLVVLFAAGASLHTQAAVHRRVQAAEHAYTAAQAKLTTAQQNWTRIQQELSRAAAAHQAASNKVHAARLAAAQRHGAEVGMTAAVTERDAAARAVTARRDAIEHEMKSHSDYQAAEKDAEAARKRLGELADDKSLTEEQQQKLGSDLAAQIRHPTEMRKAAETKDNQMQKAARERQAAEKKIVELQPRLRRLIDSDPAVIKAQQEEKQMAAALEKARAASPRVESEVANAQIALDRQNQNLQAAIAQSRRHR